MTTVISWNKVTQTRQRAQGNTILVYGSTRATRSTLYLCVGQRGQHGQNHTLICVGQRGQHGQHCTFVQVNVGNTVNTVLLCESTRATRSTPYLCMGQRGQHHTYVWGNTGNTVNAIHMYGGQHRQHYGATQATSYLCMG